jgi:predicted nucleic acid-binding protein
MPLGVETHERGLALAQRYRLGIFDAMIAAAALEAGCESLWSEDMQHGLVVDRRLTVRNPFAD